MHNEGHLEEVGILGNQVFLVALLEVVVEGQQLVLQLTDLLGVVPGLQLEFNEVGDQPVAHDGGGGILGVQPSQASTRVSTFLRLPFSGVLFCSWISCQA